MSEAEAIRKGYRAATRQRRKKPPLTPARLSKSRVGCSLPGICKRKRSLFRNPSAQRGRRNSPTQAARAHGMMMPAPVILRPSRSR
jgi:hypothetical protein